MSEVSIIMYHYVRDLKHSRFPALKGLSIESFKRQLHYIVKNYRVIRMEDLMEAVNDQKQLPDESLLLTFDDGYIDHFNFVFPVLNEIGLQGSFFPSMKLLQEHIVLDVNKIHFILASVDDTSEIISDLFSLMDKFRKEYSIQSRSFYERKLNCEADRYDTQEIVFIKKMLQRELPEELRKIILTALFNKYVTSDERSFSHELYMSDDHLKCLINEGMYVGSHGFDHYWLNTLSETQQKNEVVLSLESLRKLGGNTDNFAFCYPYGAYNYSLLSILSENGCCVGLTTNVGIADLTKHQPLILPRLDTNDLYR